MCVRSGICAELGPARCNRTHSPWNVQRRRRWSFCFVEWSWQSVRWWEHRQQSLSDASRLCRVGRVSRVVGGVCSALTSSLRHVHLWRHHKEIHYLQITVTTKLRRVHIIYNVMYFSHGVKMWDYRPVDPFHSIYKSCHKGFAIMEILPSWARVIIIVCSCGVYTLNPRIE